MAAHGFCRYITPRYTPIILLFCWCFTAQSVAGQAQVSFKVSETIINGCQISEVQPVDFSDLNIADLLHKTLAATGKIELSCTPGTDMQIALDNGKYAKENQRRMRSTDGEYYLPYMVYRDPAHSQLWQQDKKYPLPPAEDKAIAIWLYLSLPPQVSVPHAGNYQDTLGITVTY
ncbi:spore coat U domain-containing protein [Rahnella ecdela]|uniref:Spore coat protein U domain-containing protein n=1 Tax=Rahnella ecdela TaxID=2816250 RepID=A0ABS6LDD6_9GAMM|nr:spore coat U domain-containing protein [Rahnella ecdela]MBU9844782.1 spore coat protein U domain-containing protein [Rahnella ecdela]